MFRCGLFYREEVMKRIIGLVLMGLGIALVVLAPLLRFYVGPTLAVTPLNQYSETSGVGVVIKQVDISKLLTPGADIYFPANVPVKVTGYTKGDVVAAEQEQAVSANLAIFDTFSRINVVSAETEETGEDGRLVTASTSRYAFGRQDSELANCCGANSGGDEVDFEGIAPFKWPFFVEQQSYDIWDANINAATPAEFVAEEERAGMNTYKFVQSIAPTVVPNSQQTVPANAVGLPGTADVVINPYYSNVITTWIEPTTGQVVDTNQKSKTAFRGPDGTTDLVTFLEFEAGADPAYVAESAPGIKDKADSLNLVLNTLPLISLILGIVLAVIGFFVWRSGSKPAEEDETAPTAPPAAV